MTFWLLLYTVDNGNEVTELRGPYATSSEQIAAARAMRDSGAFPQGWHYMLWLDIHLDNPTIGPFDPQFWEEKKA